MCPPGTLPRPFDQPGPPAIANDPRPLPVQSWCCRRERCEGVSSPMSGPEMQRLRERWSEWQDLTCDPLVPNEVIYPPPTENSAIFVTFGDVCSRSVAVFRCR